MRHPKPLVVLFALYLSCATLAQAQEKKLPLAPLAYKADLSQVDLTYTDPAIDLSSDQDPAPKLPFAPGSDSLSTTQKLQRTQCAASVTHSYPDGVCLILLDRQTPGAPLPVTVPKGTLVKIVVINRPDQENLLFLKTTDAIPPPDYGLALLKLALPAVPLINQRSFLDGSSTLEKYKSAHSAPTLEELQQGFVSQELDKEQQNLDAVTTAIEAARKDQEERFHGVPTSNVSSQSAQKSQSDYDMHFNLLREQILAIARNAARYPLPVGVMKALEAELSAKTASCYAIHSTDGKSSCLKDLEQLENMQARLADQLAKIQAKQSAVATLRLSLLDLPLAGDFTDVVPASPKNHRATIKVSAKDLFTGTSTDLTTVVITWQGTNFSLASGVLISTLPSRSFANPANVASGAVTTGNTVTEQDTRPSYVTPTAMFNYEFFALGKAQTFGVNLTAGLGANLTTKSADYAAGISLRIKNIFLTPVVDIGREVTLANGVAVGDTKLGTLSTVPTEQHFKPNFGFALSYRIPIP